MPLQRMPPRVRLAGSSGSGDCVLMTSVCSSGACTSAILRVMVPYEPLMVCGLLTIRHSEKMTSCAVKGWPLENFTPSRSLNSQVLSSSAFHEVASRGTSFMPASCPTSVSKMCAVIESLGVTWW